MGKGKGWISASLNRDPPPVSQPCNSQWFLRKKYSTYVLSYTMTSKNIIIK